MLTLISKGVLGNALGLATNGYLSYTGESLPGELPAPPPEVWRHPVLPTLHLTGHEAWLSHMPGHGDIPDGIVLPTHFSPQTLPSLRVSGNESWISNLKAAIKKASNRSNN
jgi:hypothetical protein